MRLTGLAVVTAAALALATPGFAGQHGKAPTPHPPAGAKPATPPASHTSPPPASSTRVPQQIAAKPQLAARLQALLPPGTHVETAAAGFRNQGQFIAAVHVSKNLGIPFDELKTQMVTDHLSLGQSIQKLRPTADTKSAIKEAETQEKADLDDSLSRPAKTKHGSR